MTSIAFIAGVFPLVISQGAGAEMRQAMGVAVFAGMIGVTIFGLFLTPVFYVVLMKLGFKKGPIKVSDQPTGPAAGPTGAAAGSALVVTLGALVLTGCTSVGPDYKRPDPAMPAEYKSPVATNELGAWKEATPLDTESKGPWWELFGDQVLNDLAQRASVENQELKAAVARVEQARASARVARGEFLPTLGANPGVRRERYSPNQEPSFGAITVNTFSAPLDFSYEVDLWGRVRRSFESARADAQSSLAAMHQVQLTLQADLAQNYFSLRALDNEIATVRGQIGLRQELVRLARSRFEGGIGNELDIARAENELATTEAEIASLERRRAQLENAIAILVGENPSNFRITKSRVTRLGNCSPRRAIRTASAVVGTAARRGGSGTTISVSQRANRNGEGRLLSGGATDWLRRFYQRRHRVAL